jgi:hypothetical protein
MNLFKKKSKYFEKYFDQFEIPQDTRMRYRNGTMQSNVVMYRSIFEAYERYILASTKNDSAAERKAAIESLVPGTLNYYHLYFLDLVKSNDNQKFMKWSSSDLKLYKQFSKSYKNNQEF